MSAIPDVENRLYGGRTLDGYTDQGEHVAGWPEDAYGAIRAINHLTGHGPISAPTVYRILGELKGVGHLLPQACVQMARGLQESLDAFDVYDLRRDPSESVTETVIQLKQALREAAEFGELLEAAQTAISEQGYLTLAVDDSDAATRASHDRSDRR